MLRRIANTSAGYAEQLRALSNRSVDDDDAVEHDVRAIISAVRTEGDAAVANFTQKFDGRLPPSGLSYELDRQEWRERASTLDPAVAASLQRAADRIRAFHCEQKPASYTIADGSLGLRAVPLARVGLYVPGGTAAYPSSVLMTAIPAAVAGVEQIVMVTPDANPATLAAAEIAGVTRVFEIGGAQAVAALAYGTASVPRVDKIVGPGNKWVAAAKRLVFGAVDIDSIAGPSEVLIVADDSANPAWVAADLLAQAEHDVEARPILVTPSTALAEAVDEALAAQLPSLSRHEIARASIDAHGVAVIVASIDEALEVAEDYAPEHLELCFDGAKDAAASIRRAGAVFVGSHSPEAAGDYVAGPNHVLPTAGAARYASPLGVYDFYKYLSVIDLNSKQLAALREDIERLAGAEGLDAHAQSVAIRFETEAGDD
jgi:histidinol dehydrogenase